MNIDLFKYIFPGIYFYQTRLHLVSRKISFLFIYIVPSFYIYTLGLSFYNINTFSIFYYILSIASLYLVYEIGYIENDTISNSVEVNSTKRLNKTEYEFLNSNKGRIYLSRLFLFIIVLYIHSSQVFLTLSSFMVCVFYFIYNRTRFIRLRLPIHFILVTSRYYFPCYVCFGFDVKILIFSMLIFPLHNTLERCREEKFNFSTRLRSLVLFNASSGRVIYYFFICLLSLIFDKMYCDIDIKFMTYGFLYFFVYRLFCLLFESCGRLLKSKF